MAANLRRLAGFRVEQHRLARQQKCLRVRRQQRNRILPRICGLRSTSMFQHLRREPRPRPRQSSKCGWNLTLVWWKLPRRPQTLACRRRLRKQSEWRSAQFFEFQLKMKTPICDSVGRNLFPWYSAEVKVQDIRLNPRWREAQVKKSLLATRRPAQTSSLWDSMTCCPLEGSYRKWKGWARVSIPEPVQLS